jgi:hypothetical protein
MEDAMTRDDDERPPARLSAEGDDFARLLLRSRKLDIASEGGRERAREFALAALGGRSPSGVRWRAALFGTCTVAVAAAAWLLSARARAPSPLRREVLVPAPPSAQPVASGAPDVRRACPKLVVADGHAPLIDDMEDRNARLLLVEGRSGAWTANGDATAKQSPKAGESAFPALIPGSRGASHYAIHAFGEQLRGSGAGIGANFAPGSCYDASRYTGIEVWARARGKQRIFLALTVIDVMSAEFGGFCQKDCYDAHRKALDLNEHWQLYRVHWAELEQGGWGTHAPFDPKRLLSFEFRVDAPDSPFDFWFDDVSFSEH